MSEKIAVFWFRRDLRLHDNNGLFEALEMGIPVLPVFIFDPEILEKLSSKNDARVSFVYSEVKKLKAGIEEQGSSLKVFHAKPIDAFRSLIEEFDVATVYCNKNYEPEALKRDREIGAFLYENSIAFKQLKDHVIFEENDILKDDGKPYTIFTPYSKRWKKRLEKNPVSVFPSAEKLHRLLKTETFVLPQIKDIGFEENPLSIPPKEISDDVILNYPKTRDFPAIEGTTRLGIHLRFGTISIRELIQKAIELSQVFLNELIWREFYMTILWHFPHVIDRSFRKKYNNINWRNNEKEFKRWCEGQTGYPMVDAGMRELNETGFMHNRVRMVTASFLTKHLLIDWRWGEAYFAEKLLDYELASNNGNWQWAAGTGCDAAPYFRIFNPENQQKKFDPKNKYVMKWVPEVGMKRYPEPIVEHKEARERALKRYKDALK